MTLPEPFGWLDWLPVAAMVFSRGGSPVAANAAWLTVSSLAMDDWRGEGWLRAIEPAERADVRGRVLAAAAAGERGGADCHLAASGGAQWSRWRWQPIPSKQGLVVTVNTVEEFRHPLWHTNGDRPDVNVTRIGASPTRGAGLGNPGMPPDLATATVNRIFGVGLLLQSAAGLVERPGAAARVQEAIDRLDRLITDVRRWVLTAHDDTPQIPGD